MILVITTGGTFDTVEHGIIGPPLAEGLLQQSRPTVPFRCLELMRMDSSDMDDTHRLQIHDAVATFEGNRVVIVHGTDTMLETAKCLSDIKHKTLVLTGAFTPASRHDSDASFNLGGALVAVQLLSPGMHIVIGGEYLDPCRVRKNLAQRRFERVT